MPFTSRAQVKKFDQLLSESKITREQFDEWHASTPNIKKLPWRVKPKKKKTKGSFAKGFNKATKGPSKQDNYKSPDVPPKVDDSSASWTAGNQEGGAFQKASFVIGFGKTAEPSMSMEANQQSGWSIGDYMPGEKARQNATTGQFKGKNYRTEGVQNEGKEFNQKFKQKAQTARGGTHDGGTISKGIAENR